MNAILTLLLHVLTDENDNIEIDTNEEIPEGFVVGGGDELTNIESDLDNPGNFKLSMFCVLLHGKLYFYIINNNLFLYSFYVLCPC
jgi:hypothetical protein